MILKNSVFHTCAVHDGHWMEWSGILHDCDSGDIHMWYACWLE